MGLCELNEQQAIDSANGAADNEMQEVRERKCVCILYLSFHAPRTTYISHLYPEIKLEVVVVVTVAVVCCFCAL